jgi:hypothetical protein
MSNYQPVTQKELIRSNEKRLNKLERRANPGGRLGDLETRVDQLSGRRRNLNGTFVVNQRGYVSGTAMVPGTSTGFGHDRWRTSERTNLVYNSGAEVNTNFVQTAFAIGTTLSRSTAQARTGSACFAATVNPGQVAGGIWFLTPTTNVAYMPVIAGQTYTFYAYCRSNVASRSVFSRIRWLTTTTTQLASSSDTVGTVTALGTSGWTLVSVTGVAPAGVTYAAPYLDMQASGGWVGTNVLYADDAMFYEGADFVTAFDGSSSGARWFGTALASASGNQTAASSYTFTQTPQGCTITITGAISYVFERSDLAADTYVMAWTGGAQGRIYNRGTAPPAFAASGSTWALDGTADVVMDFNTGTLGNVQVERGTTPSVYEWRSTGDEHRLCLRYYWQSVGPTVTAAYIGVGLMYGSGSLYCIMQLPAPMRIPPLLIASGGTNYWGFDRVGALDYFDTLTQASTGTTTGSFYNATQVSGTAGTTGIVSPISASCFLAWSAEL